MKIELGSTIVEIENFKESTLWNDINNELNAWNEGFDLERRSIVDDAADSNPSTAAVLMHLGDLNGREKAVDYMLGILDMFTSILEVKKDDTGRNQTD